MSGVGAARRYGQCSASRLARGRTLDAAWLAAVQPAVVDEDLADVDELRRALTDRVDPEELARLPVEQEMATVRPIFAAAIAAFWPAAPLPMTTRS